MHSYQGAQRRTWEGGGGSGVERAAGCTTCGTSALGRAQSATSRRCFAARPTSARYPPAVVSVACAGRPRRRVHAKRRTIQTLTRRTKCLDRHCYLHRCWTAPGGATDHRMCEVLHIRHYCVPPLTAVCDCESQWGLLHNGATGKAPAAARFGVRGLARQRSHEAEWDPAWGAPRCNWKLKTLGMFSSSPLPTGGYSGKCGWFESADFIAVYRGSGSNPSWAHPVEKSVARLRPHQPVCRLPTSCWGGGIPRKQTRTHLH